ncbi:hypothetical protein JAGODDHD_03896 (plasmid) [Sphingomonas paucimobilis]|jgi:hypothetical protein|nr:hypothetical protein [Sphingomonas paucimobilis]|tara:strand:+ start:353 stop:463 length:111 start_codon:yes stop_codon:yes gene_type:complete
MIGGNVEVYGKLLEDFARAQAFETVQMGIARQEREA